MINFFRKEVKSILDAGIPNSCSFTERKKLRLQNNLLFVSIFIPIAYIILFYILGFYKLMLIEIVISLTSILTFKLNITSKQRYGSKIVLYIIPLQLFVFPIFVGDIGVEYFYLIFVVLGLYLLEKKRQHFMLSIFLISLFILAKYFALNLHHPSQYEILEKICMYPNMLVSIVLIMFSTSLFKFDNTQYLAKIETQANNIMLQYNSLKEKDNLSDNLIKELNHRVKNNLQLVSGLISMEIYQVDDEKCKEVLRGVIDRINTISILHQHLYRNENSIKPNLKIYIEELLGYIVSSAGMEDVVALETFIENIELDTELTLHIGILVNELLTNSLKHGVDFEKKKNQINLKVYTRNKELLIFLSDSGFNMDEDNFKESDGSFGMKIVRDIVERYKGKIQINTDFLTQQTIILKILS